MLESLARHYFQEKILEHKSLIMNSSFHAYFSKFDYDLLLKNPITKKKLSEVKKLEQENLCDFIDFLINKKMNLKLERLGWETALIFFDNFLKNNYFLKFFAYLGKFNDLETIFSIKNYFLTLGKNNFLLEGLRVKTKNISFRNNFIFNMPMDYILNFDRVFFIGINPTYEVPLFAAKIRQLLSYKNFKIYLVGAEALNRFTFIHLNVNFFNFIFYSFLFLKKQKRNLIIINSNALHLVSSLKLRAYMTSNT